MSVIDINIIGAGRLGKTLGKLFALNGARVVGVTNLSIASAQEAISFIGQGQAFSTISELPKAQITFITTPDGDIESCARELRLTSGVVVHCSGCLSLPHVASLHPLRSFADPKISIKEFAGTYCAIEGDEFAKALLFKLVASIGGQAFAIDSKTKALYHAAAVMASNYVVTVFDKAVETFISAGVEEKIAPKLALSLMDGTLKNLHSTLSSQEALTGPIMRGDVSTITQHLGAMPSDSLAKFYKAMGVATLDIARLAPDLDLRLRTHFREYKES